MLDTSLNSTNFYFLVAVLQGAVLAFIIMIKKPRRSQHFLLGILIFLFSLSLLHMILEESIHAFNSKFPVPMEFSLSYGPLMYLHIFTINNPKLKLRKSHLLHFSPSFLLDFIFFSSFFIYIRYNENWAYANLELIQTIALSIAVLTILQLGFYTYMSYKEIKHGKSSEVISKWFRAIAFAWLIIISFLLIAIPIALLNIELLDEHSYLIYKPMGIIMSICIYGLGYLYLLKYLNPVNTVIDRKLNVKFSDDELISKGKQLLSLISENQYFKDPSISVAKLANKVNWPVNDVSLVINQSLSTNFNDLINAYRVEAFLKLSSKSESKRYSIQGLAEEVGFSSKASFYRAFKKEKGVTPTQYLAEKP